jgi:branched-chain amino acid transport system substrate-binding protein
MKLRTRLTGLAGIAGLTLATLFAPAQAQPAPIKIGFAMSQSGPLAANGKAHLIAMQMWAEDTNAKGGLLGRKVELVTYDDQSNGAQIPGIYTKLLEVDKVDVVVSPYGTNMTAPAMPTIMQHNMTFMTVFNTGTNDKFKYDRYFGITPSGSDSTAELSRGYFAIADKMNPKPKTIALISADAEFAQNSVEGARVHVKKAGYKVVYDKTYAPSTVDYAPILRAVQATNPDIIFIASYPQDSVGLIRAANEFKLKARMVGGGMIGPQFGGLKLALGENLNGLVTYDVYSPQATMQFPGLNDLLERYRPLAVKASADPIGIYGPPYAYAEMQVIGQAIAGSGGTDQGKLNDYMKSHTFDTVVGKIKFDKAGEWDKARIIYVQYQGVKGNDPEQFKKPGVQPILYPPEFKSGDLKEPFTR